MIFGANIAAKIHIYSNMHNCTSVSWIFCSENVQYIPRNVFNRNQSRQDLQRHPIFINDSDNNYIIDEILHQYQIECEINLNIEYTAD